MIRSKYRFRKVTRYLMSLPSASDSAMASRVGSETPTSSILSTSEGGGSHEPKSAPTFLPVGAAVSAKYRGAFCEALIERVALNYRVRVQLKAKKACVTVDKSSVLSGNIEPNSEVSVLIKSGDFASTSPQIGSIVRITDLSLYTVVFDDGDKRSLKRTQLVLKGERHFKESESLDRLPLTNPEQFKQPVIDRNRRYQSSLDDDDEGDEEETRRRRIATPQEVEEEEEVDEEADEEGEEESTTRAEIISLADEETTVLTVGRKVKKTSSDGATRQKSVTPVNTTPVTTAVEEEDVPVASSTENDGDSSYRRFLGSLVMIDMPIAPKGETSLLSTSTAVLSSPSAQSRRRYAPGLVVLPSAMPSIDLKAVHTDPKDTVFLVKSFRENRFFAVPQSCLEPLSRAKAVKLAHRNPSLRTAFERAILWLDRHELPASWGSDSEALLGPNWQSNVNSDGDTANPSRPRRHAVSAARKKSRRGRQHRPSTPYSTDASSYSSSDSTSISIDASSSEGEEASSSLKRKSRSSKPIKRHQHGQRKTSPPGSSTASSAAGVDVDDVSDDETGADGGRDSDSSTSSDSPEYFEERDRWIAKLYRFMDARGTPINKAPSIANKDLDLFKLYRKVDRLGGFHRVTSQLKWAAVYSEMDLPHNFSAGPRSLQTAFKKYLFPLDDLSRKLGTSLDEIPIPLPRKSKSASAAAAPPPTEFPNAGQKSVPKTISLGGSQLAKSSTKLDDSRKETTQRKSSTTKDEKPSKIPDLKSRSSTSTTPVATPSKAPPNSTGSKKTSPSSDVATTQKKEKKLAQAPPVNPSSTADATATKNRGPRKSATPEPSLPPPPPPPPPPPAPQLTPTSSPSSSSKRSNTSKLRVTSGRGLSEEPQSASSSPILPTFENQVLIGGESSSPHSPLPLGAMVRVHYKGQAYKAKIVQHVYDHVHPGSATEEEDEDAAGATAAAPQSQLRYRIHYAGWNARHDEVVGRERIISIISCVRRSPSCSALNLSDRPSSTFSEDVETVSDGGIRHLSQRRSQKQRPRQAQQHQQLQQRGRQAVKRPSASSAAYDSDSAAPSSSIRKALKAVIPEDVRATPKRSPSGQVVDVQPAKKRRLQSENKPGSTEIKFSRPDNESSRGGGGEHALTKPTTKSSIPSTTSATTSSIVDAATSLAQSPNLLKKAMSKEPVELKSQPVSTSLLITTLAPAAKSSSSKLGLEDISSDEDAFPPQQHSTPVSRLANALSNTSGSQQSSSPASTSLPPPYLSPPVKRIKPEATPPKVGRTTFTPSPSSPRSSKATASVATPVRASPTKTAARRPTAAKKPVKAKPKEGVSEESYQNQKEKEEATVEKLTLPHKPSSSPSPSPISSHSSEVENNASPPPPPSSSSSSATSKSVDPSSSDEDDEDEDHLMATSDVLPRLTRSQHRLILGDTPPGAQLLTATANPPAVKKEEEAVRAPEETDKEKDVTSATSSKSEKGKKTILTAGKKAPSATERSSSKKATKVATNSTLKASAPSPSPPSQDPAVFRPSRPPSPASSVASDSTEPMRLSPPSHFLIPECRTVDPSPLSPTAPGEGPRIFPLTPAPSSSAELSPAEESKGEEEEAGGEEEEGEEEEEEEGEDVEPPKSHLPPPRPSSARGRSPRGTTGRTNLGRRRRRNVSSAANDPATNDDAESVVSSSSSGFRSGKKSMRGRRGAAVTATAVGRCSSPVFGAPVAEGATPLGPAVSSAGTVPPPAAPAVRRFGGPYYPIPNLDTLPSATKCLILQHRLVQIIESWRSAKQMLKAVEQRAAGFLASSSSANASSGGSGTSGRGGGAAGTNRRGGGGGFRGGPRRRPPSVNQVEEAPSSSVGE